MKAKILLVDCDNTLTKETCWTEQECLDATPDFEMIDWVNEQAKDNFIVIRTARKHELYLPTIMWLNMNNVRYNSVSFGNQPGICVDRDAINNIGE